MMARQIIDGADVSDEELALARRYPMIVHWSVEDGEYVAEFPGPGLEGIKAFGATAAKAAQQGEEVIVVHVTSLLDAGEPLPEPVALAAVA